MGNWDFLLQKKGDRQWVTAHKADLNLKAGSYRIAAKGSANAEVSVTITFDGTTQSGESIHKTKTRSKQTNRHGLLAIFPFTNLKPGVWSVVCHSLDIANPWEETLTITIRKPKPAAKLRAFRPLPLPPNPNLFSFEGSLASTAENETVSEVEDTDTEENILDRSLAKLMSSKDAAPGDALKEVVETTLQDLDEQSQEEEDTTDWQATETATGLLQGSLQELDDLLQEELEPIWQEMDLAAQEQTEEETSEQPDLSQYLDISLHQSVLTWHSDRPGTLTGGIHSLTTIPEELQSEFSALKLRFELLNPQDSQALVTIEQNISGDDFPQNFRQVFAIDPTWQTLAIVGSISLETSSVPPTVLSTQSFNLVADYQAIAANISLPEVSPEDEALMDKANQGLQVPDPDSFIVAETVPEPSTEKSSVLPPKLNTQGSGNFHAPELPTFIQTPTAPEEETTVGEAVLEETEEIPALPGGDEPVAVTENKSVDSPEDDIPYPFVLTPEEQQNLESTQSTNEVTDGTTEESEVEQNNTDIEAQEFDERDQADLDWNSRFFQRLNTMATEVEDSSWLEEKPPEPEDLNTLDNPQSLVELDESDTAEIEDLESPEDSSAEEKPKRRTMEIVVDSLWDEQEKQQQEEEPEAPATTYDASGLPHPQGFTEKTAVELDSSAMEIMQPVPEPIINLSKPEYHAEDMAVVRVTLPPHPDRLYVKLWLQDRQTRSLLAGPFQLTDFSPDSNGISETLLQVSIPKGSLEIRFEAIAINPRFQQESRKVGVDRHVTPKDFSEMNWDDLEV